MSKWLMRLNESNKLKIKKRIEKLKAEYEEYRLNYNDFPYDRYLKAMESRKAEIEELEKKVVISGESKKRGPSPFTFSIVKDIHFEGSSVIDFLNVRDNINQI